MLSVQKTFSENLRFNLICCKIQIKKTLTNVNKLSVTKHEDYMQINSISTSNFFIGALKICDFIPIVSAGTNIYILYQKRAHKRAAADASSDVKSKPNYTYFKNKPAVRCFLLMIPGINFAVAIYHISKGYKRNTATPISAPKVPVPTAEPTDQKSTPQAKETTNESQTASIQPKPVPDCILKGKFVSDKIELSLLQEKFKPMSSKKGKNPQPASIKPQAVVTNKEPQPASKEPQPAGAKQQTAETNKGPQPTSAASKPQASATANTEMPMSNVLQSYSLFLDASQMANDSMRGYVQKKNHWFSCTISRPQDNSTKITFYYDFDLKKQHLNSIEATQAVFIPQASFDSIVSKITRKVGTPAKDMNAFCNGITTQPIAFNGRSPV